MKTKIILPKKLPIFPLSNFIFFPKTSIPLNIFEPRYLQMINDSIKKDQIIGMIQPKIKNKKSKKPEIYSIGCAGKITDFKETKDKRIELVLNGISRFKVLEELNMQDDPLLKIAIELEKIALKDLLGTSKSNNINLNTSLKC